MALVVEDNTGLANAESYVDATTLSAYATNRGIDLSNFITTDLEAALRKAFTYVNTTWRYKSIPTSNLQAGEFPRQGLSDGMGRIFNNIVPQRAKDGQCEAAIAQLQGTDLFTIAARGGQVQSEGVGPIRASYAPNAPAETLFQAVSQLLNPFVRDALAPRRALPDFNNYGGTGVDNGPIFGVGMDDNPDDGSTPLNPGNTY